MSDLTVVIVNWNTEDLLLQCLRSIRTGISQYTYDVYVIDNASEKNCSSLFKRKQFSSIKFIQNEINVGFAKANNQVLKQVKTKYVLMLNPDTVLQPKAIDVLINFLDNNKNIGACGPLLLNSDKSIQKQGYYRRFPSLIQTLLFYTEFSRICSKYKKLVDKYWETNIDKGSSIEVDQIPGACILSTISILNKLNYFDEDYPLWFEDVDLCYRLRQEGYKLILIPSSRVIHIGGSSFIKWTDELKKQVRFYSSLLLFMKKHHSSFYRLLVKLVIIANLIYLIATKGFKQMISPNTDRKLFILNKIGVLKCILVS